MGDGTNNPQKPNARRGPARPPLPRPKLPGPQRPAGPAPGSAPIRARAPVPNHPRGPQPGPATRPRGVQPPGGKRPSAPIPVSDGKKPSAPVHGTRRTSNPVSPAGPVEVPAPKAKKEPTTIEELIPVLIRHAVKRDEGLQIPQFEEKFFPRIKAFVPESLQRMENEIIDEYLVDIAHALYVAIVVGQFSTRPVLCGVRAAELGADLIERVLQDIQGKEDKRITQIRCGNLLVGLTLSSVRLLESTSLMSQTLQGFTDSYERAVITTYGLKTQAEATGNAPWVGDKNSPLDKRIGRAINTMSNVFGDYIGQNGHTLSDGQYQEVMTEFDGFMDRFAPYIEGGRSSAEERRRKLARGATAIMKGDQKVEPLEISELRTRPAGVEILLADKRILFVSTRDAKRIGQAAEGEIDDTAKREREALEKRRNTDELRDGDGEDTSDSGSGEDAATIARIEAQMKANKRRN
jgi:hypothetical protein